MNLIKYFEKEGLEITLSYDGKVISKVKVPLKPSEVVKMLKTHDGLLTEKKCPCMHCNIGSTREISNLKWSLHLALSNDLFVDFDVFYVMCVSASKAKKSKFKMYRKLDKLKLLEKYLKEFAIDEYDEIDAESNDDLSDFCIFSQDDKFVTHAKLKTSIEEISQTIYKNEDSELYHYIKDKTDLSIFVNEVLDCFVNNLYFTAKSLKILSDIVKSNPDCLVIPLCSDILDAWESIKKRVDYTSFFTQIDLEKESRSSYSINYERSLMAIKWIHRMNRLNLMSEHDKNILLIQFGTVIASHAHALNEICKNLPGPIDCFAVTLDGEIMVDNVNGAMLYESKDIALENLNLLKDLNQGYQDLDIKEVTCSVEQGIVFK